MVQFVVSSEEIKTTSSHLFYTDTGWWKSAKNIKVGDKILTAEGELKEVTATKVVELEEGVRIYNLNVDEFHTYFVGTQGLLVHNDCTPEMMGAARDAIAYARKIDITNPEELKRIGKMAAEAISKFGRTAFSGLGRYADEIRVVLSKEGISLTTFNQMKVKLASELTAEECAIMKTIRESVPTSDSNTVFQKVIHQSDIENYLKDTNPYNTVGGCVTRAQDTKNLITLDEIYDGLWLDNTNTPYKPQSDEFYGVIRFQTNVLENAKIPYGPAMGGTDASSSPFTGYGFTKAMNGEIVPEYNFYSRVEPKNGASLFKVNSKTGIEELVGIFRDGRFHRIGE